jgi:uncharacterized protein YlaN (UPF0358 family)
MLIFLSKVKMDNKFIIIGEVKQYLQLLRVFFGSLIILVCPAYISVNAIKYFGGFRW